LADVRGEIEDALGGAGVWHTVDCEAQTYTEAVGVLQQEISDLRGAMKADDERLRIAAERVGIVPSCDAADEMADEIERLRKGAPGKRG
jgi:predicted phage tail protein